MKNIAVVTGSRAEYSLLYWLMKEIKDDPALNLQVIVTGMHLSKEFGDTYRIIEQDGFSIAYKVEMLLSNDSPVAVTKSLGLAIIGFADAYEQLQPDWVVLLGDRYEIFAAAQAAVVYRIPIAHIHGGETCGSPLDESIRHAITKMALLHFTTSEQYKKRVIQLGESPDRVVNYGPPILDHMQRTKLLTKQQLQEKLEITFDKSVFLVCYHNYTLNQYDGVMKINSILDALDKFPNAQIVFTCSNADPGGRLISDLLYQYQTNRRPNTKVFINLGMVLYYSLLRNADVLIGNSSSGIIEAPYFKTPTVNIGNRQKGRLMAESIICCKEDTSSIVDAINKALSPEFLKIIQSMDHYQNDSNVSFKIKEKLKYYNPNFNSISDFYDLEV